MNRQDKQIAFMNLFEPMRANLSRFCRAISSNNEDAKDLMSETLLQAFDKFENLKNSIAFKSYLFSIASRINKRRIWRQRLFIPLGDQQRDNLCSSLTSEEASHDVQILYQAMSRLVSKQQEAIALFEISGFSLDEVREIQGGSISGVKSRLKRGREKLSEILKNDVRIYKGENEIMYSKKYQPEGKVNE